jgi:hypothetical protein
VRASDAANKEAPIGLLTGTQRDTWTELHGHLSALSPQNKESFTLIETALFAVALDDRVFTDVDSFASEFSFLLHNDAFHSMNGVRRI